MAEKQIPQMQLNFAYYYSLHGKKQQAAIDAGYSKKTAAAQATRLLKNVKVQDAIKQFHTQRHMGPEEVMAGLADIARLDMGDFASVQKNGGTSLDLRKAKKAGKLGLIRELQTDIEVRTGDDGDEVARVLKTKVKLYDKQRALETLARHHGLLKDPEINITINIHLELITQTWNALVDAGIDPVKTFEGLIQIAHAERNGDRPAGD